MPRVSAGVGDGGQRRLVFDALLPEHFLAERMMWACRAERLAAVSVPWLGLFWIPSPVYSREVPSGQ